MKTTPAYIIALAAVAGGIILSGCATSNDIGNLKDDIYQLQLKLNEMQRNQADLSAKMDTLNTNIGPLTAALQENQNRMSLLGQRLDDMEANVTQKVSKLSEQVSGTALTAAPAPSDQYRVAYGDFSRGKYDLAITGFRSYLDKYPQGELAAQAQYYLGESYYAQNDREKALEEFKLVEKNYPQSDTVAPARLKEALCLESLGRTNEAVELYRSLVSDYPNSPEAFTAQEKLKNHNQKSDGKQP